MTLHYIVKELEPVYTSPLAVGLLTAVVSAAVGSHFGLKAFRHNSRELLDGAVAWEWVQSHGGKMDEEPFLVVQNRSAVPAFLIQARYLRGIFIKREAQKYAFAFIEPTDGNFPLPVNAEGVTSYPLQISSADKIASKASWYSKVLGYVLRRSYLWIEVATISGQRLTIPANDATSFQHRPLWLEGRWFPVPKPDWLS